MNFDELKNPFHPDDIEWRIQQSGIRGGNPWALVLAYITNRAIMDRLDKVCRPENWKNEYSKGPDGGILCGLSLRIGDEWITKFDGAENTKVESVKGGLSDAMKRAAVQWGIGRYLYNLPAGFADVTESGRYRGFAEDKKTGDKVKFKWNPPALPKWALPEYDETTEENKKEISDPDGNYEDNQNLEMF